MFSDRAADMNMSCCKSYCAEVLGMRHKKTSSDDHKAHIRAGSSTYSLTVGGMTVSRKVGRSEFSADDSFPNK